MYQEVWRAAVEEDLACDRETSNERDRYAVVVKKGTLAHSRKRRLARTLARRLARRLGKDPKMLGKSREQ